jgi:hypothetical protein
MEGGERETLEKEEGKGDALSAIQPFEGCLPRECRGSEGSG